MVSNQKTFLDNLIDVGTVITDAPNSRRCIQHYLDAQKQKMLGNHKAYMHEHKEVRKYWDMIESYDVRKVVKKIVGSYVPRLKKP